MLLEEQVRIWTGIQRLGLGVVRANPQVLPFGHNMGYVETAEVKPYRYGQVDSEALILEKRL